MNDLETVTMTVSTPSASALILAGLGLFGACQTASPLPADAAPVDSVPTDSASAVPVAAAPVPAAAAAPIKSFGSTFDYPLARYDENGDDAITADEYTRHDGQLERWDTDCDGRVTAADWPDDELEVVPQIMVMQRQDVLGRYFQTDENGLDILTIDELENAFYEYDDAGTSDLELSEEEFLAQSEAHAIEMPGDGSMMAQNYVGDEIGWERIVELYDTDGSQTLSLAELSDAFAGLASYELHFNQVRFDDGAAGAHFERVAYEAGLVVGSPVPNVTLSALRGGAPVELAKIAGDKPIALIFGSYT